MDKNSEPLVTPTPPAWALILFPVDPAEQARLEFELAVFGAPVRMADDDWPEEEPAVDAA